MTLLLLVEDNAGDVELVRRRLASLRGTSFEIVAADTLEGGVAAYHARPADVVLLDLNLPDSDGLGTIETFRKEAPAAPVVVLTGIGDLDTAVEALRRGADDYIGKGDLTADLLARTLRYAVERRRMIASLDRERSTVAMLQEVGAALASELDRDRLVQKITDLATRIVGARFGAFFYSVETPGGAALSLYTLSGAPREAFEHLGLPSMTTLFGETFRQMKVVRSDDVRLDPRYGRTTPRHGIPAGHLPVVSYLAVPVVLRDGTVLGGLLFGHPERARFTEEHERLAIGVAGWAAVAMDNARLYETAIDAARARENLLQVVSHDLRNHMATVGLSLQILRKTIEPERARHLDAAERASKAMRRLLEDLVDIAAIEKGVLSVQASLVEAGPLLEEAHALFAPLVESRGVSLAWESVDRGVVVWADRERFLQILGNLVTNAIKFTPAGGRIAVTVRVREGDLEFGVEDSGPGIPELDRERVFDRFFRGSRPTGHGAGLGLAIARALVRAHGGDIGVGGAALGGARFHFTLPKQAPSAKGDAGAAEGAPHAAHASWANRTASYP